MRVNRFEKKQTTLWFPFISALNYINSYSSDNTCQNVLLWILQYADFGWTVLYKKNLLSLSVGVLIIKLIRENIELHTDINKLQKMGTGSSYPNYVTNLQIHVDRESKVYHPRQTISGTVYLGFMSSNKQSIDSQNQILLELNGQYDYIVETADGSLSDEVSFLSLQQTLTLADPINNTYMLPFQFRLSSQLPSTVGHIDEFPRISYYLQVPKRNIDGKLKFKGLANNCLRFTVVARTSIPPSLTIPHYFPAGTTQQLNVNV